MLEKTLTVLVLFVGNVATTGGIEERKHGLDVFDSKKRCLCAVGAEGRRETFRYPIRGEQHSWKVKFAVCPID